MEKLADLIKEEIANLPRKEMNEGEQAFVRWYLGTQKEVFGVKINEIVRLAKEFLKRNDGISISNLINVLSELFSTQVIEDHFVGGKIFTLLKPEIRAQIPLEVVGKWLEKSVGWVECDVICQSSFSGPEVLKRWAEWSEKITEFSKSDNIELRRASLVLQVKPIKECSDPRLRKLAYEAVDRLKYEKVVLITKAISWLLRALTVQNKEEVRDYLLNNEKTIPRIAYRETMKVIETGKKTSNKS